MEDRFDSTSQTSTVFTHESRVFSLENESSQADTVLVDLKLESQESPQSPSLLEQDDILRQERVDIKIEPEITRNLLVASTDSNSNDIHLRDCNVSQSSAGSVFILSQPEATWIRDNAFINLSTPWIQRNETEQKQCVK